MWHGSGRGFVGRGRSNGARPLTPRSRRSRAFPGTTQLRSSRRSSRTTNPGASMPTLGGGGAHHRQQESCAEAGEGAPARPRAAATGESDEAGQEEHGSQHGGAADERVVPVEAAGQWLLGKRRSLRVADYRTRFSAYRHSFSTARDRPMRDASVCTRPIRRSTHVEERLVLRRVSPNQTAGSG